MPLARPRSFAARLAARASLFLVAFGLALLALEGALRLALLGSLRAPEYGHTLQMFDPHPTRGWKLKPGIRAHLRTPDFSVLHATNSRGYRDVEHELAKPPGVYRVVVLGDSFMEAGQVGLEESFARVLEGELDGAAGREVEVINLGCSGYGQVQELLALREEGLAYQPDLVLLALFLENDLRNNHPELEQEMGWFPDRPFARLGADGELEIFTTPRGTKGYMDMQSMSEGQRRAQAERPFWERSLLYDRWTRAFGRGGDPDAEPAADPNIWLGVYATRFDPGLFARGPNRRQLTAPDYERMWDEARAALGPLLAAIGETCDAAAADFLVFTVPGMAEVDRDYQESVRSRFPTLGLELERSNAEVALACSQHGVEVLDLLPAFRAAQEGGRTRLHHPGDRHWNAAGHRLAAREVAAYLLSSRFSP
jgi:hypothetical protein